MTTELVDAMGIPLADHAKWLPARAADFPRPAKIVDKEAAQRWLWWISNTLVDSKCWWCGSEIVPFNMGRKGEVHHICRHDAPWAFAWLCATCHRHTEAAVHSSSLPRMLRLKHQYDREHCLWIPLAIALGRFLPVEEEVDKETWRMVLDAADERSNFGTY